MQPSKTEPNGPLQLKHRPRCGMRGRIEQIRLVHDVTYVDGRSTSCRTIIWGEESWLSILSCILQRLRNFGGAAVVAAVNS